VAKHHPSLAVDAAEIGKLFKAIMLEAVRAEIAPIERFELAKIAHSCGQITTSELKEFELVQ